MSQNGSKEEENKNRAEKEGSPVDTKFHTTSLKII
jgi:hypothetical protein